jgi:hypothetical protein
MPSGSLRDSQRFLQKGDLSGMISVVLQEPDDCLVTGHGLSGGVSLSAGDLTVQIGVSDGDQRAREFVVGLAQGGQRGGP